LQIHLAVMVVLVLHLLFLEQLAFMGAVEEGAETFLECLL
jgi:hypothetical protein